MKPLISLTIMTALMGCSNIEQAKLDYEYRTECFASYTVHCVDVNLQRMILQNQAQKEALIEHKADAVREAGQANYERLLALLDEKTELLESQRPNVFMRWFRGDHEYPYKVNDGWKIDAKMKALTEPAVADDPTTHSPASSDEQQAAIDPLENALHAPVQTADQSNAQFESEQQQAALAIQNAPDVMPSTQQPEPDTASTDQSAPDLTPVE